MIRPHSQGPYHTKAQRQLYMVPWLPCFIQHSSFRAALGEACVHEMWRLGGDVDAQNSWWIMAHITCAKRAAGLGGISTYKVLEIIKCSLKTAPTHTLKDHNTSESCKDCIAGSSMLICGIDATRLVAYDCILYFPVSSLLWQVA